MPFARALLAAPPVFRHAYIYTPLPGKQVAATGADLNVKFHLEGGQFEMAFGSLDLFYGGLERLLGPPQMINGRILDAMEADHCKHKDSTVRLRCFFFWHAAQHAAPHKRESARVHAKPPTMIAP